MFYGTVKTHEGEDVSLHLQAVEITDTHVILRLRDTLFVPGPHDTKTAAAVGTHWALQDGSGHRYNYEQASSGGGPFQGLVDIAFLLMPGFDATGQLLLESSERSIRFSL